MLEKRESTVLAWVALIYLLLCVRLSVRLDASFENGQGRAVVSVGAWGKYARWEYVLVWDKQTHAFRLKLCSEKKRKSPKKKNAFVNRLLRHFLLDALRGGRFEVVMLRLAFGDASHTAIAVGMARTLLSALLACFGAPQGCNLCVTPDFEAACLRVCMAGIFSCGAGDIMLAALKAARGKRARN